MKCPRCESTSYRKNGCRKGKQNYLCKNCGKQFLEPALLNPLKNELISDSNGRNHKLASEANLSGEKTTQQSSEYLSSTLAKEQLQSILLPEWLESIEFHQFLQNIHQKIKIQS